MRVLMPTLRTGKETQIRHYCWTTLTRAPKYSTVVSLPPLVLMTSVTAAKTANISLCSAELGQNPFRNLFITRCSFISLIFLSHKILLCCKNKDVSKSMLHIWIQNQNNFDPVPTHPLVQCHLPRNQQIFNCSRNTAQRFTTNCLTCNARSQLILHLSDTCHSKCYGSSYDYNKILMLKMWLETYILKTGI